MKDSKFVPFCSQSEDLGWHSGNNTSVNYQGTESLSFVNFPNSASRFQAPHRASTRK